MAGEATNGASLTLESVQKLIKDTVATELAPVLENQRVIADTMAADAKAKKEAEAAAAAAATADKGKEGGKEAKPLTAEDVARLTSEAIAKTLTERDAAAKSTAARDAFIADKLKNVPAAYHAKLGSDPAKWAAEEQVIRDGLKADLTAMGLQPKDVKGGDAGGVTTSGDSAKTTEQQTAQYKAQGLSDGAAEFATQIKLPGAAAAA